MAPPDRPPSPEGEPSRRNTFPRARRLKRQRLIRALFDRDRDDVRTVRAGTLVVRYRIVPAAETESPSPLQVGFATRRHLRTKPVRNRIKRVMREVVRHHQHSLLDLFADRPDMLTLMVLYQGGQSGAEAAITRDLPRLLAQIEHDIASTTDPGA